MAFRHTTNHVAIPDFVEERFLVRLLLVLGSDVRGLPYLNGMMPLRLFFTLEVGQFTVFEEGESIT